MILDELFTNIAHFGEYVSSMESNASFKSLNSSATSAKKQIVKILTIGIYNTVKADTGEQKEALRAAIANLTLANQLVFDAINRRKGGTEVYKYELEGMKREFTSSYYNGMDTLISLLNTQGSTEWKATSYCVLLNALPIKSTEEFDLIYPIDQSYLFFFRCLPLQKEVFEEKLHGYFEKSLTKTEIIPLLKRILAKLTIATALRRFDILEFPNTVRDLFSDSKVMRYGSMEQQQIIALADQLTAQAESTLKDIDMILSSDSTTTDISTQTSYNRCNDKIIFLP